jgi:hypothetical protein
MSGPAASPEAVTGTAPGAGGKVKNSAPTVEAIAPDAAAVENDGAQAIVLRGSVLDPNGEKDLATFVMRLTGAASSSSTRTIVNGDTAASTEPVSFPADGWKVWTGTASRDGRLWFAFRFAVAAFAPTGAYQWSLTATDSKSNVGAKQTSATVSNFSRIAVDPFPVYLNGTASSTTSWGEWSATPGDTNVTSATFLRIRNSGAKPDPQIALDFNEASFVGATDPSFAIPINGNVQFAAWEDTTPATSQPSEGSFTFLPLAGQGTAILTFNGRGNVMYVQYRLATLPAILGEQAYGASMTATELPP